MFCKNCGKEIDDKAVVCPYCGVQTGVQIQHTEQTNTLAIVGFVLSFFISIAGLICSIIAYRKCRDEHLGGKGFAIAGIAISSVSIAAVVIYLIAIIGLAACVASAAYVY